MRSRNPPSPAESPWRTPALCCALAGITLAVFARTLGFPFVNFDDDVYVYNNPIVAQGLTWKGIAWAFHAHANNWHPLTWISHMLDCQIYGMHPAGHHFTNVFLHTVTVISLFLVWRALTGAVWRSAFVAAVFAIHPLRVESVAWVAERKDVLSGLFFVLTVAAYTRYARLPWSARRYALVLGLFALGLMSKPMLVTTPIVLLLLDFWPLQRNAGLAKLILEKVPLLLLSVASIAVTVIAQGQAVHLGRTVSIVARAGHAAVAALIYLRQLFWPAGLAVYYPYPFAGYPTWEVALAAFLLLAISVWAWARRRDQPWKFTGWFWYLTMLIPVAGLVQIGGQAHADRYTYLPQIGIVVALTWCFGKSLAPRAAGAAMILVLAALMACAVKQTTYWENSEALWTHDLACTTENELAYDNLAAIDMERGDLDGAIAKYREASRIDPAFNLTHFYLARALGQKGNVPGAISEYQTALKLDPTDVSTQYNLAWLLATAPQPAWRNGPEAVRLASQANASTGGRNPVILRTLAAAFASTGHFYDAIKTAQAALETARASRQDQLVRVLTIEMQRYQAGKPLY